jgi:fimbrial chaperone protein
MMIRAIRLLARAATGAALVSTCAVSHAANFTVSPVRVELSPSQTSSALTVKNEMTDEPVVVELNTVAW